MDAQWYEIFAKAGLSKAFKVLMKFDEAAGVVRAVDGVSVEVARGEVVVIIGPSGSGKSTLLNRLLNEMDGLAEDADVVFVLTTNRADLLEPAFLTYKRSNPWVADAELAPKSVVRDMVERSMTFAELVSHYGLARSEGLVLRYLADAEPHSKFHRGERRRCPGRGAC